MAQATHSVTVPLSVDTVWDFVSKIEKWATLVPAYKEHEQINDEKSVWTFEGNMKGIKKTVKMELEIIEFNEPNNIKFTLIGLTENFKGSGQFQAEEVAGGTNMIGTVEATAGGISGAVLNPMIKMVLPKVTVRLTEKIARTIQA
ncbi:MAG: CoxG family protein [Lysinibacillus sp.]